MTDHQGRERVDAPQLTGPQGFALAQILRRGLHLLKHAAGASETEQQLLQEIESWGGTLDRLTRQTAEQLQAAAALIEHLGQDIHQQVARSTAELRQGIRQSSDSLGQRVDNFGKVLGDISQIGATVRMLSLNATIEAARAGEAGRGFAVVASEVRALAQRTLSSAERARRDVRFDDVQVELNHFSTTAEQAMAGLTAAVEDSNSRLSTLFAEVRREIDAITEQNRVLRESLTGIKAASRRAERKSSDARQLIGQSLRLWDDDQPALVLEAVMREQGIISDPGFDRLDDIRRRGRLRVAVEPDFKGLSFRQHGRLTGLDIDYASAFARWLGVTVEFIEHPWDLCVELLHTGRQAGEPAVDLVWSALPPHQRWPGVAYSEPYSYLRYVLARRVGSPITGLGDLGGKVLGCINDPAAFATLEAAGLRWAGNDKVPGGRIRLANLVAYTDQGRIHDCLADGSVDAFAVDKPIYHWACTSPDSPWRGRIEILPGDLAPDPWYYAVGVADDRSSRRLLRAINEFIAAFATDPARAEIERRWQGEIVTGRASYRDEPGRLRGADELEADERRREQRRAAVGS